MKNALVLCLTIVISIPTASPGQASEWGCEVLLCASSSNPSWKGVETCHPPMERLIDAMEKPGFSWPTCPEGGAGKPGYDRYADCPAGWTPTGGDSGSDRARSEEQSRCTRTVNDCSSRQTRQPFEAPGGGHNGFNNTVTRTVIGRNVCSAIETVQRPLRTDPYYFDIKDDQTHQTSRFWFNLEK